MMATKVSMNGCDALAETLGPADAAPSRTPVFPVFESAAYARGPELARGGLGRIRLATDLRVGRRVAIKELVANTQGLAARFVREARLAAQLQHPNIIPIYEVGCWADGTPFYSMRHVEGCTLYQAIAKARTLEARMRLLPSIIAAADAVAFAHASGVVHRDLTPSNILVGEFGETVVIDWGLAKDLLSSADAQATAVAARRDAPGRRYRSGTTRELLTGSGIVIGTPAYMPLEQAEGKRVDERADVYALGAILYHLIAGRPAYLALTPKRVLDEVRAAPPPPLSEIAEHAPRALVSIVARAMARDAADRYANAKELVLELRRFQAGLVVEAHSYSVGERVGRWEERRRPLLVTAMCTLAVAMATLAHFV